MIGNARSIVTGILIRGFSSRVGKRDVAPNRTDTRILDAAVHEAAANGVDGITIEGVARRAGVNRTTVYRRFGDRDSLLEMLVLREGRALSQQIADAVGSITDPREVVIESFAAAIRFVREHPVLERIARLEPESLIAGALANDAAVLRFGARFVADGIRAANTDTIVHHVDPDEAGEVMARLFAAFVLLPGTVTIDLHSDQGVRTFAARTLAPMLFGSAPTNDDDADPADD